MVGEKNAFCLDVTAGLAIYLGRQREARICEDRNGGVPGLCRYDIGPRSSSLFFFFLFCLLPFHLFLHQHPFPGSWSPLRLTPTSLCKFSRYTVSIFLPVPPDMKEHQSSHRKVQKREGTTSSTRHALNSNIHIFFFLYIESCM